jgi:hypothetical protein
MLRLATLAAVTASLGGCIIVSDDDSTLTLVNDSSYVLEEVRLAEINDPDWGPNLLPRPLFPGDELVITDIDCGTYDVLVVDETDLDCELRNLNLCFDDELWVIDDVTLDFCAFGKTAP